MRSLPLLLALGAGAALGQARIDTALTVGLNLNPTSGAVVPYGAVRLDADYALRSTANAGVSLVGQLTAPVFLSNLGGLPGGVLGNGIGFQDLGSSVHLRARPLTWDGEESLSFELFPFNSTRVRTAFDFANFWGAPAAATSVAPVLRAGIHRLRWDLWGAVRVHQQQEPVLLMTNQKSRLAWTGLAGLSGHSAGGLRFDLTASIQDRGSNLLLVKPDDRATIFASGVSGRLSWDSASGVRPALDLITYANDPERFERFAARESYERKVAASLSFESGFVTQNLSSAESTQKQRDQQAMYFDLQARVRLRNVRLYATGRYRTLTLLQFDLVGTPPFNAFTTIARLEPHLAGWLGLDYHFAAIGLTPGLLVRVIRPASRANALGPPLGGNNPPMNSGNVTVFRDGLAGTLLPPNAVVDPIIGASLSLRFEAFDPLTVLCQLDYERDPNSGGFESDTLIVRIQHTVSFQLLAQVRF